MNDGNYKVDQRNASAEGDIAARDIDKSTTHNHLHLPAHSGGGAIAKKLEQLKKQLENREVVEVLATELQQYFNQKSIDGVVGLERKLEAANLSIFRVEALEQKEKFAMFLEEWKLYSAAQELIVLALSKVKNDFNNTVFPDIKFAPASQIQIKTTHLVVDPICDKFGNDIFIVDSDFVFGMIYWLAEQCYIRWHHAD